jgi:sec-independent protein translocase protein TatB
MFDAGMLELTVVAVIALVVLGPERLPVAMRAVGRVIGQGKGMLRKFQQEMEVQARNLDMKERLEKNRQLLAEYEQQINSEIMPQGKQDTPQ